MARRLPSLNGLKAFEAAARHLSFTHAAEELFVTQGAISRQIKQLEQSMRLRLFHRLTRKLELTEDGLALFPAVSGALDDIERAVSRVQRSGNSGILTLNVLPTFAMNWLMPRLHDFSVKFPDIEVHLMTSIRPVDFTREDVDLAIRVGHDPSTSQDPGAPRIDLTMTNDWKDIRSQELLSDILVPVASPDLIADHDPIESVEDLLDFQLLHVGTRSNAWPDWLRGADVDAPPASKGLTFGHFFSALQAARDGLGIAISPKVLVEADIASGNLFVPIEQHVPNAGKYYVLGLERHWNLRKTTVFREWLIGTIDGG